MSKAAFPGFPLGTLHFLNALAKNNNRKWFDANKDRYEAEVRGPALAFIEAMAGPLAKVSPHFRAVPKKVGGSLIRIYRDVRFSKDKRPYKTNVGIQFRHEAGRDIHAPGYYLHIETDECFFAAGIWHPDSDTLRSIREAIDSDGPRWKRAVRGKAFRERYDLGGRQPASGPLKGYEADHPLIEDLKRKDYHRRGVGRPRRSAPAGDRQGVHGRDAGGEAVYDVSVRGDRGEVLKR